MIVLVYNLIFSYYTKGNLLKHQLQEIGMNPSFFVLNNVCN